MSTLPGLRIVTSEAVPAGTAYVLPSGPAPTREATAAEAERWLHSFARIDFECTDPGGRVAIERREGQTA